MAGMKHLQALIGTYPHTEALKSGAVRSDRVALEFVEFNPVWDGFKYMVREQRFDVCEMAAVTFLLAKAHGKRMALLPAAMIGRFQHPYAIYNAENGALRPQDLSGKRVGIRSFTTTTGAWIRGILANDYAVDLDSIRWVTFEDPHVAEYEDTTERAPPGKAILPMLLDGELDVVLGETSKDPRVRPLFEDPSAEAQRWYASHRLVPINHLVVVRQDLVDSDPEAVREVYRMLLAAKDAAGCAVAPDPLPFGIEANRPALELIAHYAYQQGLVPRRFDIQEMFEGTRDLVS
jgi:4,5-dihydroxyphthalate decarboxylase